MLTTTATNLKAKLGFYMKAVRAGKKVIITDRGLPTAQLCPVGAQKEPPLPVFQGKQPSSPPLGKVAVRGLKGRKINASEMLLEDRQRR